MTLGAKAAKTKKPKLTPSDRKRCQGERPNGHSFMTLQLYSGRAMTLGAGELGREELANMIADYEGGHEHMDDDVAIACRMGLALLDLRERIETRITLVTGSTHRMDQWLERELRALAATVPS